jgi:hypothetical protein
MAIQGFQPDRHPIVQFEEQSHHVREAVLPPLQPAYLSREGFYLGFQVLNSAGLSRTLFRLPDRFYDAHLHRVTPPNFVAPHPGSTGVISSYESIIGADPTSEQGILGDGP